MKKLILLVVLLAVIGAGVYFFLNFRAARVGQAAAVNIETAVVASGDLTQTISAIGKVRSRQSAMLPWKTSGTIGEISVEEGTKVKAGDKLASLTQASLPQNVILAQSDLYEAQKTLDNLTTSAEDAKIQAMQKIVTYEQDVRDAQYQLDNFTTPTNLVGLDTVEAVEEMKAKAEEARLSFEEVKYASSNDREREARKNALDGARSDYNAAVKRLQYEYDLEVAQANLERAHQDYAKWKDGPIPAAVEAAKAKVAAAESALTQSYIAAPFDGEITQVNALLGDQVSSGTQAFRLDDLSSLFVDLDVSEIDIAQLQVGQEATVTFDALQGRVYHGKVSQVAMISAGSSTTVNYRVTIEVTDPDERVLSGMTAEVEITVAQKENVILIPNQSVREENGKKVVYILRGGEGPGVPTAVEVELGISNDTNSELASGNVKAGDLLVVNPETAAQGEDQMRGFGLMGGGVRSEQPPEPDQFEKGGAQQP